MAVRCSAFAIALVTSPFSLPVQFPNPQGELRVMYQLSVLPCHTDELAALTEKRFSPDEAFDLLASLVNSILR